VWHVLGIWFNCIAFFFSCYVYFPVDYLITCFYKYFSGTLCFMLDSMHDPLMERSTVTAVFKDFL